MSKAQSLLKRKTNNDHNFTILQVRFSLIIVVKLDLLQMYA